MHILGILTGFLPGSNRLCVIKLDSFFLRNPEPYSFLFQVAPECNSAEGLGHEHIRLYNVGG